MTPKEWNRGRMQSILESNGKAQLSDTALNQRINRIVCNAEAGTLSDADSRALAAFAVSTLRDCL